MYSKIIIHIEGVNENHCFSSEEGSKPFLEALAFSCNRGSIVEMKMSNDNKKLSIIMKSHQIPFEFIENVSKYVVPGNTVELFTSSSQKIGYKQYVFGRINFYWFCDKGQDFLFDLLFDGILERLPSDHPMEIKIPDFLKERNTITIGNLGATPNISQIIESKKSVSDFSTEYEVFASNEECFDMSLII